MASIPEALRAAVQYQQAGQLDEAEHICRQILEVDPDNLEARSSLARMINQRAIGLANQGRIEEAAVGFRQALEHMPEYADAHNNLGNTLLHQRNYEEAETCYRQALQLSPHLANAYSNLANVFKEQGKFDEAIANYQQALHLNPNFPEAYNNLGTTLVEQSKFEEAEACYRQAVNLKPDYLEARSSLADVLREQGRLDEALTVCRQVLQLGMDYADAYNNLGNVLKDQGKLDDALEQYRQALRSNPGLVLAHINLGIALAEQERYEEAEAHHRQALQLKPDAAEAYNGLGSVLREQARLDEAIVCFQEATRIKQDYAEAHWNGALTWLLAGNYERGWSEYEWRWRCREFRRHKPSFTQPLWDGSPLDGRTILLCPEQGLGDTIQFIRYAPLVKERGGVVVFHCPPNLCQLLRRCPGIDRLVPDTSLVEFDLYAPLLSLPAIFGTSLETIPTSIPYLFPDPELVEYWQRELAPIKEFKIGISWRGVSQYKGDRHRSCSLLTFAPLARLEGVRLFSLQKGAGMEEVGELADQFEITDLGSRIDNTSNALMDTVAIMQHLDLIVSVDTAISHCAGALGVPVWVIVPFVSDWRWQLEREDSPWYPSMRLFRQKQRGDWSEVFERVAQEVKKRKNKKQ